MTRRLRALFLLALAGALSGGALRAEERGPLEPPDLARYLRWGPLRVRPGFQVSNLGYEDNIFYATGDTPPVGDATVTLSPRLDALVLLGDRGFFTYSGRLDYTLYQHYPDVNFENIYNSGRAVLPVGRIGLFVDLGLNRTKEHPVDVQDVRLTRREAVAGGGVILDLGWRTDGEIGWQRSDWSNFESDYRSPPGCALEVDVPCYTVGDLLDRRVEGLRAKVRYRVVGRTRLLLEARDDTITFDNPDVGRDAVDRRLVAGVEFGEGGRLSGGIRLGPARIDPDDPSRKAYDSWVGDTRIAYRVGSGTTLQASFLSDISYSIYTSTNLFKRQADEVRVVHYFNRTVGFDAGLAHGRVEFPGDPRLDRSRSYDAAVRLRLSESAIGRRVEYSFRMRRARTDSNFDAYDQSRTTFGFGASLGY